MGMLKFPVQGEEASISAAPATIFRKYFMSQDYLLDHIQQKFTKIEGQHATHAVLKDGSSLDQSDSM